MDFLVTGIRNKLKDTALTLAIKSKNVELASLILDKNPDLGNCPNVLNLA
jgi:ankyrin repeat protein